MIYEEWMSKTDDDENNDDDDYAWLHNLMKIE